MAVVLGLISFPLLGGRIYLVGIAIFLMPVFLRLPLAVIGAAIALVLTDFWSGFVAFTWMSLIAYLPGVIVIRMLFLKHSKLLFVMSVLLASIYAAGTYFWLETITWSRAAAWGDLAANGLQFAIVIAVTCLLYVPVKLTSKVI